jgi:hypothetical protein
MKKFGLLCLGLCLIAFSHAQSQDTQLIGTAGTTSQVGDVTLDWSVGEVVTTTYENNNVVLTQGYQQGELSVVSIADPDQMQLAIKAYPNPVVQALTIEMNETGKDYKLYNFAGQIVATGTIEQTKTVLEFGSYEPGTYFLQIDDTKTHKIIKK